MPYQQEALAILNIFLAKLERYEKKEFVLLANRWGVVQDELNTMITKLAEQENLSEDKLYRLELYKRFLEQSEQQIKEYSLVASGIISNGQMTYGVAGIEVTQEMIEVKTKFFERLPKKAVNAFIGKSYYDGALINETLFAKSYPKFIDSTKEILLKGVALGRSPRETARLIRKESNAPFWQALRLARTEQMQIYRETNVMQMQESGVVDQKERLEQNDACQECREANGKLYNLDVEVSFHPNCRGTWLPVIS